MDGADAWRVAACANTNVNRIMLRFRPIAPKPVAGSSAVSRATGAGDGSQSSHVSVLGKRPKRKYVRIRRNGGYVRKNNGNSNRKSNCNCNDESSDVAVVTLQLMPEKDAPEGDVTLAGDSWCKNVDLDLTVEKIQIVENRSVPPPRLVVEEGEGAKGSDLVPAAKAAESWVTVESVTGTCMGEGEGGRGLLSCTDEERVKSLETDTCPGFVCDGSLRVRWVNDAYKRMVLEGRKGEGEDIMVWLKVKDSACAAWWCYSHPAFTCGVRLQYTWRNEKCTKMVPCDVWRLDCGGFAWRLDVKAALSLGL
ncbi:hypothetical protein AAZX31_05G071500 [Glycine max]|uniref:DUF7950 domain-containing protein n=2 Tax=Glycine subgen. Soja TaxID=1462606 RepID=I1K145_SOYBN|nr:uncharacterized protein LOC114412282 [Glycine soja]XP_040871304.1 uncharacterized protein LOC102663301 [Glycine max]KAG5028484.1 hypothetical protein JHK87_011998 [Glycine soja]KAG5039950.1 hypothetical protein JHK85_012426 [Glycine max]KAG5057102.1 hypothetical protein JHK86_012098 [Glycine max]KAG5154133.1 hypothetical protein JHK82_012102 [Glycine max]KAH1133235.1 hypothetical protein GYH30_011886 [Glycine max]|eukprot:XP_006580681.1 uncharacterized protein LOC102663301 [Glycine max]